MTTEEFKQAADAHRSGPHNSSEEPLPESAAEQAKQVTQMAKNTNENTKKP